MTNVNFQAKSQMGFGEAVKSFFGNYANFKGRARRSEFWWAMVFLWILYAVASGIDYSISGKLGAIYGLVCLATVIPTLAVSWRRLHDIGKSGANWLWCIVPVIGAILLIIWYVRDSEPDANRFGTSPKYQ